MDGNLTELGDVGDVKQSQEGSTPNHESTPNYNPMSNNEGSLFSEGPIPSDGSVPGPDDGPHPTEGSNPEGGSTAPVGSEGVRTPEGAGLGQDHEDLFDNLALDFSIHPDDSDMVKIFKLMLQDSLSVVVRSIHLSLILRFFFFSLSC